jgi:hypothetical protein
MKVDFNKILATHTGTPALISAPNGVNIPVTASAHIQEILFASGIDNRYSMSAEQKYMAYRISRKLYDAKDAVDITVEEANLIKEIAGAFCASGIYGQICDIIEGN